MDCPQPSAGLHDAPDRIKVLKFQQCDQEFSTLRLSRNVTIFQQSSPSDTNDNRLKGRVDWESLLREKPKHPQDLTPNLFLLVLRAGERGPPVQKAPATEHQPNIQDCETERFAEDHGDDGASSCFSEKTDGDSSVSILRQTLVRVTIQQDAENNNQGDTQTPTRGFTFSILINCLIELLLKLSILIDSVKRRLWNLAQIILRERIKESDIESGRSSAEETKGVQNLFANRRKLQNLPLTQSTFELIAEHFSIHRWISRVISRADVPIFERAVTEMQFIGDNNDTGPQPRQAIIYNCRTSNAWPEDLALTVTHFPEERVTFAILFGCSEKTERNVIARLKRAGQDAAHPMLLPGIVAELERSRQMEIVEKMIDNVEGEIFQLDTRHVSSWRHSDSDRVRRNRKKRVAWLNTTYARNALTSWKTQLSKMAGQVDEYTALVDQILGYSMEDLKKCASSRSPKSSVEDPMLLEGLEATSTVDEDVESRKELAAKESFQDDEPELSAHEQRPKWGEVLQAEIKHRQETLKVGMSLKDRLVAICDEYEDRVRDCTMRVEGMAMTTQWSHGETNVEIATATGQDSSQMRSIALVTMIFLPGTFFASIFSMSFFNWSPSGASGDQERQPFVSQYIWIYVSVTALFTLATLTLFWYFIIHRPKRARKLDDDDSDCESIDF